MTNEVKQAPTLFGIMFSAMLTDAFRVVMLVSLSGTGLMATVNLMMLQAKSKVQTDVLDTLPYKDAIQETMKKGTISNAY